MVFLCRQRMPSTQTVTPWPKLIQPMSPADRDVFNPDWISRNEQRQAALPRFHVVIAADHIHFLCLPNGVTAVSLHFPAALNLTCVLHAPHGQ